MNAMLIPDKFLKNGMIRDDMQVLCGYTYIWSENQPFQKVVWLTEYLEAVATNWSPWNAEASYNKDKLVYLGYFKFDFDCVKSKYGLLIFTL